MKTIKKITQLIKKLYLALWNGFYFNIPLKGVLYLCFTSLWHETLFDSIRKQGFRSLREYLPVLQKEISQLLKEYYGPGYARCIGSFDCAICPQRSLCHQEHSNGTSELTEKGATESLILWILSACDMSWKRLWARIQADA